jgi:hypothetical protein
MSESVTTKKTVDQQEFNRTVKALHTLIVEYLGTHQVTVPVLWGTLHLIVGEFVLAPLGGNWLRKYQTMLADFAESLPGPQPARLLNHEGHTILITSIDDDAGVREWGYMIRLGQLSYADMVANVTDLLHTRMAVDPPSHEVAIAAAKTRIDQGTCLCCNGANSRG